MSNRNDLATIKIVGDFPTIRLQEVEKLIEPVKKRSSQLYLEFDDLCYSVINNKGKLIIFG